MKKFLILTAVLLVSGVFAAGAQDLLRTNPNYLEARELQIQAEQNYARGEYELAAEQAREAERLAQIAQRQAEERLEQLRANSWRAQAERRLRQAESQGAPSRYPDVWRQARDTYDEAVAEYSRQNYDASVELSREVIGLLDGIDLTK